MPEAAMDENDLSELWKNHVGPAGKVRAMEAIAKPHGVAQPAHDELRPRVSGTDRRHATAALLAGQDISHREVGMP